MRVLIAAVGKLKNEEECAIVARYRKRFDHSGKSLGLGPLTITELPESRAANAEARKADEAGRLVRAAGDDSFKIALDAAGKPLTSEAFAKLIGKHADGGTKTCAFLIGGPDGQGDAARQAANVTLSLGLLTLPHGLARVVLVEQLFRAATILAGHPYHRA